LRKWLTAAAGMGMASTGLAASPPSDIAGVPVVLLTDPGSGRELYARRADLRFVPASMVKVMTARVAFMEMAGGRLSRDRLIRIDPALAREWNGKGTSLYLRPGEMVSVDSLLHAITIVSANDAAMALAVGHSGSVRGWTGLMNAEAMRLGMTRSRFATPTGWPDNGATFVTARDLVTLAGALILDHPLEYKRYFGKQTFTYRGVEQRSHNPFAGVVKGADGIKTGHTREAGYNFLGSAERDGTRLIMVIAGARSEAERARASRALLEWGFAAWQRRRLFAAGQVVGTARVQGGDARHVPLLSPVALHAAYPRGMAASVRLTVRYRGPLVAPIARGAQVAVLEIATSDGGKGTVPLHAANSVGRAGLLDRMLNGLYGMVS